MILYSRSLAEKVIKPNADNVYVLAVHPGAVNTKMQEVSQRRESRRPVGCLNADLPFASWSTW